MRAWIAGVALLARATAFVFEITNGTVNECGRTEFTFTPGSPPYRIAVLSEYDVAVLHDVPSSQIKKKNGLLSYEWTLPYDYKNRTIFIMSDVTGFATGGVSGWYTVGPRPPGAQCTLRSEDIPFYFIEYPENNKLPQCSDMSMEFKPIKEDGNFTIQYPITITAAIPNGEVVQWTTMRASTDWHVNVAAGNEIVLAAWDAAGNQAGTSYRQRITESRDETCLDKNSPSPTPVERPTPGQTDSNYGAKSPPMTTDRSNFVTVTRMAVPTDAISAPSSSSAGIAGGTVAGIVIGAVAGLLLLQALLLWLCCGRQIRELREYRRDRRLGNPGVYDPYDSPGPSMAMLGPHVRQAPPPAQYADRPSPISPFGPAVVHAEPNHIMRPQDLYPPTGNMQSTMSLPRESPRSSFDRGQWNTTSSLIRQNSGRSGQSGRSGPSGSQVQLSDGPIPGAAPAFPSPNHAYSPNAIALAKEALESKGDPSRTTGVRQHEDAGSLGRTAVSRINLSELPPDYKTSWESQKPLLTPVSPHAHSPPHGPSRSPLSR